MSSLNNEAFAHRMAIGRRFAERISAGDAVFLVGSSAVPVLPYTVSNETKRNFSGVNAFMLMQVMKDRSWMDARFFTAAQIDESGWVLKPNALHITLQYLVTTGADGLPLEKPTIKRFSVFNATQIDGVPQAENGRPILAEDVYKAASAAGHSPDNRGINAALEQWLVSLDVENPSGLRVHLAATLLQSETGMSFIGSAPQDRMQLWAKAVRENPMSFFEMARQAHVMAASITRQVQLASVERQTEEALKKAAATVDGKAIEVTTIKSDRGIAMLPKASPRVEALFQERAAVLSVPYKQKDQASKLGAVFYPPQSIWFVPKGLPLEPFRGWDVREQSLGVTASTQTLLDSFANAMKEIGLVVPDEIVSDGKWHNVPVNTKAKNTKNKAGSYILSLTGARDGGPIGTIINKDTAEKFTWKYDGPLLTPEQRARLHIEIKEREVRAEIEIAAAQDKAAVHAKEIWELGNAADSHGYVAKKGISPEGLRQISGSVLLRFEEFKGESGKSVIRANEDYLIVPMSNMAGALRAVQAISADGAVKSFMRGAQKKGTMCVLGNKSLASVKESSATAVAYAEGIATGASVHAGSALPVIVCFDAGNLETVAAMTSSILPARMSRVLAVDNDQFFVERALGFLAMNAGLNPHAPDGALVAVANGRQARSVALGEMKADGHWHETAKGSYCASLVYEDGGELVRSIVVEVVPKEERKIRATFENRGIEAGRAAIACLNDQASKGREAAARTLMVIPEFKDVDGRPTDFNDLAKQEGLKAVAKQLEAGGAIPSVLEAPGFAKESTRVLAGISR